MPQNPPNINGIMTLSTAQQTDIKANLTVIKNGFQPTDNAPSCDTFYLVSTYNKQNPAAPINGDTAEFLLR